MDRSSLLYGALLMAFGAEMEQTKQYRSLIVFVGQPSQVNCFLSKKLNVSSWVYRANDKTQISLYTVEIGLYDDVKRYKVSDRADILSIVDTQLEDAGVYSCKMLYSDKEGSHILEDVTDLVVLGGEPGCSRTPSGSVLEGVYIQMRCSVLFGGNWAPVMTWRQNGPTATVVVDGVSTRETNTTHGVSVSSTLTLSATRTIHMARYTCTTNMDKYVGTVHSANTTSPDYNHTWTSPELNVKYEPHHIKISPDGHSYYVGEELTCSSDANPGADYDWKDLSNERVFKGASIRLDEAMANQNITRLLCTATNDISNATSSVNVTVHKALTDSTTIVLGVVPSTLFLVLLFVVALILFMRRKKRKAAGLILRRKNSKDLKENLQEVNDAFATSRSCANLDQIQPFDEFQPRRDEEPVYSQVQKTPNDTEEPSVPMKKFYIGDDGTEYMEMKGVSPAVLRFDAAEASSSLSLDWRETMHSDSSTRQSSSQAVIHDSQIDSNYALIDHSRILEFQK